MNKKLFKNAWDFARESKVVLGGIGVFMLGAIMGWSIFMSQPDSATASVRDCDDNAIVKCGALSANEFASKYAENKTGDLPAIFAEFGLSADEIERFKQTAKPGVVHKDGRVVVDGEVVATGAKSLGRHNIPGSTKKNINGKTYFLRDTSVSFAQDKLDAMVMFDEKGMVEFVALNACANPVAVTPKPPKKPKESIAQCVALTANLQKGSRTTYDYEVEINTKGNVEVLDYTFDFGDGSAPQTTTEPTTTYTYAEAGEWQTQVTVRFMVDGNEVSKSGDACVAVTPVEPEEQKPEECKPGIPVGDERCEEKPVEETPVSLPKTGAGSALIGGLSLSSLAGAAYYWRNSRQALKNKLNLFNRQ